VEYEKMHRAERAAAEAWLREELRDAPEDPDLHVELAVLLALRGNLLGAEQIVEHGLLIAPGHEVLQAQLDDLRSIPEALRRASRGRAQPEIGPLEGAWCWCGSGRRAGACHGGVTGR
jgi:hypothetical protein